VSVRSELYRHRLSQRRGRQGYWTEPKATGQLARCCDPVSTKARRAGSDAGLALLSESVMGKVVVGEEEASGSVESMRGR
jgi:hypothetical protein